MDHLHIAGYNISMTLCFRFAIIIILPLILAPYLASYSYTNKFQSVVSSSSAWDANASQYKALMTKTQFTVGYAKDAWDSIYDKSKTNVRVLDIACGTGALAIPAAEAVKETGGSVLATDFSEKMVECVKESIKTLNLTNVEARVEDGQNLRIPDNEFDYAVSVFGLIFFPDIHKGLTEALRVLKPGGKVAIVSWTSNNTFLSVQSEMLKRHNRSTSIFNFFLELGDKQKFAKKLTDAGFADVKVVEVTYPMPVVDYQKLIDGMTTNPAYVGIREELGLDDAEYQKKMLEVMKELYPTLPTNVPNVALIATGVKQ